LSTTDRTTRLATRWAAAKTHAIPIRLLALSRTFGKEAALTAGLDAAAGDAVIPIDVDLQHPPEIIPLFIEEWRRGNKVVYGRRIERGEESWLRRTTSRIFYRVCNALAQSDIPPDAGDFRFMGSFRRGRSAELPRADSAHEGSVFGGRVQDCACFVRDAGPAGGRDQGELLEIMDFAVDGIISFSTVPIRTWPYVGTLIASASLLYALWIIASTPIFGLDVSGYATPITAIRFMGGVQLISLGIIGEYIARIFLETKQRPIYTVDH
jgi:glycosyltransferase involved in cell wall biosynthesis